MPQRKILPAAYLLLIISVVNHPRVMSQIRSEEPLRPPSGLMCDLLSHTTYQSVNGYPTEVTWDTAAFLQGQAVHVATKAPRFSWIVEDSSRDVQQTAYQILVSDKLDSLRAGHGNFWDSGEKKSDTSSAVRYGGKPLQPHTLYYWKVRVWNNHNQQSPFSRVAAFFTDSVLVNYAPAAYPLEKTNEHPVNLRQNDTAWLADFGKDAFGQLQLRLYSAEPSDTVIITLGEAMGADGWINAHPGGTIRYSRYRLPLMQGWHTYHVRIPRNPKNTRNVAILMPDYIGEVTPFRYAALTGYKHPLERTDIVRQAVNYPFNDAASAFHSSDSLLNAVWELCKYTMKATSFTGVFVDGDRERTPYEADAYINQLGYYATDREYSIARHSLDFLMMHGNWPTEWILMMPLIAWNDYLYTGDPDALIHYYTALKPKTLSALAGPDKLISTRTHLQTPELLSTLHVTKHDTLRDIVDWPQGRYLDDGSYRPGETDGFVFETYNAVVNAFYYESLVTMASIAEVTGHHGDAIQYSRKAGEVKTRFQHAFWDRKHKRFRDGEKTTHASLHTNMFALAFGLAPKRYESSVLDFVRSRGMQCSVYGSQFLLDAVYSQGDGKYGLSLLTSKGKRSWYNMLAAGSTLTLEAWDQSLKPNLDWNHAWGAAPANIIPRYLMGIRPLEPGWSVFSIHPRPGNLQEAHIKVPTVKGSITMDYSRTESGYELTASIPANTAADVSLPVFGSRLRAVEVDGHRKWVRRIRGFIELSRLGSGNHSIKVKF